MVCSRTNTGGEGQAYLFDSKQRTVWTRFEGGNMADQNSFPSDSELILAIRTGDEPTRLDAEEQLVQKHNERLHDSISSFLGRKHCNQPTAHADGVLSDTW